MSLLLTEGFDWCHDTDLSSRDVIYEYDSIATFYVGANMDTNTRLGQGYSLRITGNYTFIVDFDTDVGPTITVGVAVYIEDSFLSALPLINIIDSSQSIQATLQVNTDGSLSVSGQSSSSGVIIRDTWFYIELTITVNDSTGSVVVDVDGTEVINQTSIDTQGQATDDVYGASFQGSAANFRYFDDLYIRDDTTRHGGNTYIQTLRPTGAGNYTQFTPSAGSNYQNVDETVFDSDSTYNYSSTTGQIDSFAMGDLSGDTASVYAVVNKTVAKRNTADPAYLSPLIRTSSTDYTGTSEAQADTYKLRDKIWETNPYTASAWSISEVNGLEAGYKHEAS
ncbi:MAG: hypothetical protein ACWGQW_01205 [bacterium]